MAGVLTGRLEKGLQMHKVLYKIPSDLHEDKLSAKLVDFLALVEEQVGFFQTLAAVNDIDEE